MVILLLGLVLLATNVYCSNWEKCHDIPFMELPYRTPTLKVTNFYRTVKVVSQVLSSLSSRARSESELGIEKKCHQLETTLWCQ